MKIVLDTLRKSFGGVVAVKDVNLEIRDGEFVAFLGPSGCGKTTTLLAIAGIYKPDTGRILFDDRDVTRLAPKDRNLGMVFQSYALYPHMSAYENIVFPLKLKRVPEKEKRVRAERLGDMMGIGQLLDRRPGQLSGGQQQRVALARALAKEPDALLFDEPLSNLDARIRLTMRGEIRRLQTRLGITSVYVTHDQVEALTMADRVAVMNDGLIEALGTPDEIYNRPRTRFVASFVGNPPINFFDAELADGRLRLLGTSLSIPAAKRARDVLEPGKRAVVGLRPEDVYLTGGDGGGNEQIPGEVVVVEPMGREDAVVVDTDGTQVRALSSTHEGLRMGDRISLRVDAEKVQLFDPESGESLLWR